MKQTLFCKMKLTSEGFIPASREDQIKLELYMKQFKEGSDFEMSVSLLEAAKSYAQLKRIHAIIRELSDYTGMTYDEMKNYIKLKAGLFDYKKEGDTLEETVKSFKVCSKKELDTAIIVAEELAASIDLILSV